jgi:elongation factor P--beta-lysine ligase
VRTDGGAPRYLITSPEYQMKRLLVGGLPRCFQIAKSFRRGEIGDRHNPEFTMLEWYRAFATMDEVVAAAQDRSAVVGRPRRRPPRRGRAARGRLTWRLRAAEDAHHPLI